MHNVSFRGVGTAGELVPLVLSRMDHRDAHPNTVRASWVWFQDVWQQYPGGRAVYVGYYDRDHPDSWAYVFLFLNGERGICQVKDINAALAALNCEIDQRGDENNPDT